MRVKKTLMFSVLNDCRISSQPRKFHIGHGLTLQSNSVFHTSSWIQELVTDLSRLNPTKIRTVLTSALPRISTPSLSLSESILTSGVFPIHLHQHPANYLPLCFAHQ